MKNKLLSLFHESELDENSFLSPKQDYSNTNNGKRHEIDANVTNLMRDIALLQDGNYALRLENSAHCTDPTIPLRNTKLKCRNIKLRQLKTKTLQSVLKCFPVVFHVPQMWLIILSIFKGKTMHCLVTQSVVIHCVDTFALWDYYTFTKLSSHYRTEKKKVSFVESLACTV